MRNSTVWGRSFCPNAGRVIILAAGMLAGSGKGVSRDRGLNSQTSDSCATGVAKHEF